MTHALFSYSLLWSFFGGIIPSPREPYPYLIEDLGIVPEAGHRREPHREHTESVVVYTRVHCCIHAGILLYTHVYTFPS